MLSKAWADTENYVCVCVCVWGGPDNVLFSCVFFFLFSVNNVFQRGMYGLPSKSNWTLGPIASRGGSVPEF